MRSRGLSLTLLVVAACHHRAPPAEGDKVVLGAGDEVVIGTVRIEVASNDDALLIHMHEGARQDTRHVTGTRLVKFGAHRVWFEEKDSRVSIVVRPYKPPSPLTSDDALLAADEAMSPKSTGPVDCAEARLTADGNTFTVRCRDSAQSDTGRIVKVDAVTGAVDLK